MSDLWDAAQGALPGPREDRPGQPVFAIREPPAAGRTGLRAATPDDLELLMPACASAHAQELGLDPMKRDAEGFRWRTRNQIEEERSWLWVEDGVILFKAEASAWTPEAVQLQQVWVDPSARRQRERRARARGSVPASPGARSDRLPVRPRRQPPAIGSTRRSGWSTCSTTARSSSERWRCSSSHGTRWPARTATGWRRAPCRARGSTPEGVEQARALGDRARGGRHRARGDDGARAHAGDARASPSRAATSRRSSCRS